MTERDMFEFDLSDDEYLLLLHGLNEYLGPAHGSEVLGPLIGVATQSEFFREIKRLLNAIERREPLSELDWSRVLVLAEISWASDILGAASEFQTNLSDERALYALRSLQGRIPTGRWIMALNANVLRPASE
ncbi:MAG: hypothetical protein ABW137_08700 [Mycobacterium sp.]